MKARAGALTDLKIAVIDVVFFKQTTERAAISGGPLRSQRNIAIAADHDRAKIIVLEPLQDLRFRILEWQIAERIDANSKVGMIRLQMLHANFRAFCK